MEEVLVVRIKKSGNTCPEGTGLGAACVHACVCVLKNMDKKTPTNHFPYHNTLQKHGGREGTAWEGQCKALQQFSELSHFLPPLPNPNRLLTSVK